MARRRAHPTKIASEMSLFVGGGVVNGSERAVKWEAKMVTRIDFVTSAGRRHLHYARSCMDSRH